MHSGLRPCPVLCGLPAAVPSQESGARAEASVPHLPGTYPQSHPHLLLSWTLLNCLIEQPSDAYHSCCLYLGRLFPSAPHLVAVEWIVRLHSFAAQAISPFPAFLLAESIVSFLIVMLTLWGDYFIGWSPRQNVWSFKSAYSLPLWRCGCVPSSLLHLVALS